MDYNKETIGNIIRTERTKLGLSQADLGKKVNSSGKQISNYEKGITAPPIDMMFNLCRVFNCELGYLLGEEDYSDKSKLMTMIVNETGLSNESIKELQEIKRWGNDFTRVTNSLISTKNFFFFISELESLDSAIKQYNSPIDKFYKDYDKELIDKAMEFEYSQDDFEHDPSVPQPSDELLKVILALRAAQDEQHGYSYNVKIARYELHRCYEALIESIYPVNEG